VLVNPGPIRFIFFDLGTSHGKPWKYQGILKGLGNIKEIVLLLLLFCSKLFYGLDIVL